jgi:urease beta subunit
MDAMSFYLIEDGEIEINAGRDTATVRVANTGDRPVQVGSHAHFFEVNRALRFNRRASFGRRLDIPAGTAVRFEPGDERDVALVVFGGAGRAMGMSGLTDGSTRDVGEIEAAIAKAIERGFQA